MLFQHPNNLPNTWFCLWCEHLHSPSIGASMALQTLKLTLSNCSAFCNCVLKSTNHTVLHSYGHSCIATLWLLTALDNIAQLKLWFQDVCQKRSKHPLLTAACNQRWGLESMMIIFSDTKNNRDISCLLQFQFLCFPPYQTFHKMFPPMKI